MSQAPKRVPMYIQLKNYILDQMNKGIWKPGDKLPSENELAEQFQVSRITVKNAMADIVKQGLIYRIQGRGSYIADGASEQWITYEQQETGGGSLVAFLMPRLNNLFTANLMAGIEEELSHHGYHLVFRLTHDSQPLENKILKELTGLGVKGIIIYPVEGETFNEEILKLTLNHFPLVIVDRYLRGLDTNSVSSDNYTGAYEATMHLTRLGHTKISFISTAVAGTTSIEDRLHGYERALSDSGLYIDYRLRLSLNAASPVEQIKTYLADNPDVQAIVATNATIGQMAKKAADFLKIRVPEQLSIVCFDNSEQSDLFEVPLTFMNQNEKAMGKESAKLVLSLIQDPTQDRRNVVLPNTLVIRSSTASAAGPASIPASASGIEAQ
ncbi:GntR family transcriptional regulator [Paenibacillus allorhizosphaerae]|uniref:Arabinose metabolism transcriptional repressor n=1 Tax=Paenibacillus allorhizosphaerae TaxID=2849866 RepID=A0ABM8VJ71_9BACL|nr:GntR family transcriptional regulator [Paenibacillus allorhizosphaerae]CAG7644437.1 Arabinose metabolism transcriptional repressor [Paenibacillus allorhizosphaerae]